MTRRSLRIAKKLSVTTRESTAQAGASRIPSENADHPLSQVARPAHSNRKRPKFNNDGPENSDDDDNYRNESNYTQFKRNKRRRTKMPDEFRGVRGKLGLLEKLARDVPLDIMFEIFCYLEPNDLINLARTTRDLRGILMSKSSELIWRTARSNLDGLPPLPKDLSEPQYADLLFCTHCYFCSKKGACEPPFWSFRTRCCRACAVQTFPQLYNLKRTQPRDYRDAKILPREVISPVTRIGRKSTTVRHIGHLALAQRLRAEYDALSKEEDIDIWIALKMEEQEAVREHGRLCQEWYVTMLENRQEELLEERKQMIFKKLEEIGLREEVDIMINSPQSHLFLRHDSVNQSKQLTEQAWRKIEPDLVKVLSDHRQRRIVEETKVSARQRYVLLEKVYNSFTSGADLRDPFPLVGDILNHQFFEDLIWDTPRETILTKEFFSSQLAQFLPTFIQHWRPAKILELVSIMEKNIPGFKTSDLYLATTVFDCERCRRKLHFPEMFYHECCLEPRLSRNSRIRVYIQFFDHDDPKGPWNSSQLLFDKPASETMKAIVEVCNLDPRTTTTQDLYAANPLAECSTCDQSNHWRNSGRLFMRFKELLVHKFTEFYPIKPYEYTVNSFGEEIEAIVKREPFNLSFLKCMHCHDQVGNKARNICKHLEESHGIMFDKSSESRYYPPNQTLQLFQDHWYWNPRVAIPYRITYPNFRYKRPATIL
ncbi:uncharacterized protein C8R40DRAFT_234302 [Lentinula edodes]|uniref:uncharacterized protein n=1 Tax=Lentinula edodes TaxID=5353 RepID=UPI001E8EB17C|nr:uncharacterized protein C8R40DRAFT_234302 [Lentinula edodes]KAH7874884.1 hypothetical protein C8R40DRAFT_234302 [Lentinula edodes]